MEKIKIWKREIRAGNVVWAPPGVKHWHGATMTTAMTYIAVQEALTGTVVEWMEKVTANNTTSRSERIKCRSRL